MYKHSDLQKITIQINKMIDDAEVTLWCYKPRSTKFYRLMLKDSDGDFICHYPEESLRACQFRVFLDGFLVGFDEGMKSTEDPS